MSYTKPNSYKDDSALMALWRNRPIAELSPESIAELRVSVKRVDMEGQATWAAAANGGACEAIGIAIREVMKKTFLTPTADAAMSALVIASADGSSGARLVLDHLLAKYARTHGPRNQVPTGSRPRFVCATADVDFAVGDFRPASCTAHPRLSLPVSSSYASDVTEGRTAGGNFKDDLPKPPAAKSPLQMSIHQKRKTSLPSSAPTPGGNFKTRDGRQVNAFLRSTVHFSTSLTRAKDFRRRVQTRVRHRRAVAPAGRKGRRRPV